MVSTTVMTIAGSSIGGSLIIFLVIQELTEASERPFLRVFSSHLKAFSIPLFLVFTVIVIIELFRIVS
jgi:hypothetical protein